jgi:hypothetical protein
MCFILGLNFPPGDEIRKKWRTSSNLNALILKLRDEDDVTRQKQLQRLERQGQMLRATNPDTASIWSKAVQALPAQQMKFALNAAVDTLPHNANLNLWRKKESDACPLCGERQTLIHVLNCCQVARDQYRFNPCHDRVLRAIASTIKDYLPLNTSMTVDLDGEYSFPTHITPTDTRPDIVWWNDVTKQLWLAELTISFETSFEKAKERKATNYDDLVTAANERGYDCTLITLEVGSRGVAHMPGFNKLRQTLQFPQSQLVRLLECVAKQAIDGSFTIWATRNKTTVSP